MPPATRCYRDATSAPSTAGPATRPQVARVEIARKLAEAIWHMLTREQPFAPARPPTQRSGRMTTLD